MGTVPQNHTLAPGDPGIAPTGITTQGGITSVGLQICFIQNIDTVLIAKVIPAVIAGVMACPDSVEIVLFQQPDVLKHLFH